MSAVITFDFDGEPVRTVTIDGEPWFVGRDVCRCLEISNHNDALGRLGDDERSIKGVASADPPAGNVQNMVVVREPGVYRLIFESRKPAAERFKAWVFGTVLPEIRRTGGFAGETDRRKSELGDVLALARSCELIRRTHGQEAARSLWARMGGMDLPIGESGARGESRPAGASSASKGVVKRHPIRQRSAATEAKRLRLLRTLGAFLRECCEEDPMEDAPARPLHRAYRSWALAAGLRPMSETMFGSVMALSKYPKDRGRQHSYLGLRLLPAAPQAGALEVSRMESGP